MFPNKNIFKYHNGEVELYGDPLALERRLRLACRCDLAELTDKMQPESPPEEYFAAQEKLVAAVRAAFGMIVFDPLTGKGAGDDLCLKVWNDFWAWMGEKKNHPNSTPTSAPSTDSLAFGTTKTTLASR